MSETGNRHDDAQHAAMSRVRELLERDRVGGEQAARQRPWWSRLLGLALALGVVGVFALGLNAFLAVYQRYLNAPADEPTPRASPAPDEQSKSRATQIEAAPKGVMRVENRLEVKSS